ncbi:MAG: helix-hairpin-helix domain-containing protein [Lentisphaeria bacterium]|nr:helix-hairpin-helix domain-containing protein [Candidatus Neomarinimicrobiota bacterium]MCF7841566.1 helix-hairpin-helix domain-containing protein [Lentisphaeria bacterium]
MFIQPKQIMIKVLLLTGLLTAVSWAAVAHRVDINNASLDEIMELPITTQQAQALYDRVYYQGPFLSLYEISLVESIDAETLERLKPLIVIRPLVVTGEKSRLQDTYRKVEQWSSLEGANEGLIEVWLDRLAEPINVNRATYDDLTALQNVSPIDAVAVLKLQDEINIGSQRALRSAIGLSYYGYRNLRDFVRYYDPDESGKVHYWYNMTLNTAPPAGGSAEEGDVVVLLRNYPPAVRHKFLITYGQHVNFGMSYHRQLAEKNQYVNDGDFKIPDGKWAFTLKDYRWGPLSMERLVAGNFSATFGQGVVMETTDYFSPRRDGYGWSKRVPGIFADLSGTRSYALRGLGLQMRLLNKLRLIGFLSKNSRDAVLNPSGEDFTTIINMDSRQPYGWYGLLPQNLMNSVNEVTYGGNLQFTFWPGTYLGFTSYESLYDKELRPDPAASIIDPAQAGRYLTTIGNTADTEIAAMYASSASSPLWDAARANRRIQGIEFSTVIRNMALQGEWAVLDSDYDMFSVKTDPQALVVNAFVQFDNFNLLVLYRDYDLAFDNPYQRSFSNYQRYKGSILEDLFYLQDPIFGSLFSNAAQPQAERGWFISSRYQMHRDVVANLDFDTWTRAADGARYFRTVARLEYRFAFNYRLRIRQKWQQRGDFDYLSASPFDSRETRVDFQFRLSDYDNLSLIYANSFTRFSQRRRLTVDLGSGGDSYSMVGNAGAPSEALGFTATHNFTDRFKVLGSALVYKGFFWNFEDTDFRIFDSPVHSLHWWVTAFSRIGDNWAVRLKVSHEAGAPVTNYAFSPEGSTAYTRLLWENITSRAEANHVRLQIDYAF